MNRPGFHTSEFITAALNVVAQIALAFNGTVSDPTAVKYSVGGIVAFIIARGLAKYEGRGTTPTPPPA